MNKKEVYRIESTRLINWDYSNSGFYFIIICTKNFKQYFGYIKNEEMFLSEMGRIVEEEWLKTETIRKNISLDEWKIMPNHFHAIIVIEKGNNDIAENGENNNWKINSLGSIINQFKGKCTKRIHEEINNKFEWQARFYDRIIRNEKELEAIRNYIRYNHLKWDEDEYNKP